MNLRLQNKLENRYDSLKNRNTPSRAAFMDWSKKWDQAGRHCEYCNRVIDLNDNTPPYSKQLSLDHRTPLIHGGDDRLTNLALTCNRCNLIKSTMQEDTYREFLYYIADDEQLLEKLLSELNIGRTAYKLERLRKANEVTVFDIDDEFGYLPPHLGLFCPNCKHPLSAYIFEWNRFICLHCSKNGKEKTFKVIEEEADECNPAN